MQSALFILVLFAAELLFAHAQIAITAGAAAALAAGAAGAAALGGLGLLAAAGARRRGGRRQGRRRGRGRRRHGRDVTDQDDDVTFELVGLAAVQDTSECAQKFICLLAAADSLSAMESDVLEAIKLSGDAAPDVFSAALEAGAERGAADCAAAYRNCPQTRSQLTRFASDVMTFADAR